MKQIFSSVSWYGWSILAALSLSVLLLLVLVGTGDSDQPDAGAADFQGGWTAWLDPATGELSKEKPPEGVVLPLDDKTMYNFLTSGVNLIPETRPDGSVIVDLQGRFQQGSVATINDAGEVEIHRIGGEMFLSPDGREISRRLDNNDNNSHD